MKWSYYWKSWKDTVGEKQKCWKQDDRWINTNCEQTRCCTSLKRKHSAVLVKRQHTMFVYAKREGLWTSNGWINGNSFSGSPPCCLNMTSSVTKNEPKIKKWNERILSREKVTWWKKKCQFLFSFSSSPLLRGSTSCRCQVPILSQAQAHNSMFKLMVVLLLLNCKKRLENLKFIHLASTFALKAVPSTTDFYKPSHS